MKIVVYDAYTASQGDVSWDGWDGLGDVTVYDRTAPEETVSRGSGAEIVITNKVVITRGIMEQLPDLRYIGVLATGFNVVDVAAASEFGIVVTNIPAYSTMSVAQMVFAHLLNIVNGVDRHACSVRAGEWQVAKDFSYSLSAQRELADKTMGILGLGNIGMRTAMIANAFGMRVLAQTSKSADELPDWIEKAECTDDLFRRSDVISLHCPLTDSTAGVVCRRTLSMMKPDAILINTGRGPLVDEEALAEALREHRIQAAAVDVLCEEPPRHASPLVGLDNCYITPHIAWATVEARKRLMQVAFDNVRMFIAGTPQNVVN